MSKLRIACIAGVGEIDEELMVSEGVDANVVMLATMWGRKDMLKLLLQANPEITSDNCSLVHIAARYCQLETLKWLVEEGGYEGQLSTLDDAKGQRTPLMMAEEREEGTFMREEVIAYLKDIHTTSSAKTNNINKKKTKK